jgi:integrase/recombinase XerD
MQGIEVTAEVVNDAYAGKVKEEKTYSLLWLVAHHNTMMKAILKKGSMKNYYTTEKYLKQFLKKIILKVIYYSKILPTNL